MNVLLASADTTAQLFSAAEIERLADQVPAGDTPLWEPWKAFVDDMRHLGRQPVSLDGIRHVLQSLVRHGGVLTVEGATPPAIKAYLREQSTQRGWKAWTYNTHRSKLNSFFKYLWEEGLITENPVRRMRRMCQGDVKHPTLSRDQSRIIIGHLLTNTPSTLIAHRNIVFVLLLCLTGCRVSEALRTRLDDLDIEKRTLRLPATKGGKPRFIAMDGGMMRQLVQYLEYRRNIGRNDEWLFVSSSRTGPWTYCGVRKTMEQLGNALGFKIRCHAFRRYAATQLAENNVPLEQIMHLLGHTNTRTTQLYINSCTPALLRPCTDALSKVLEPCSPQR